jgi:hypothetical protein
MKKAVSEARSAREWTFVLYNFTENMGPPLPGGPID